VASDERAAAPRPTPGVERWIDGLGARHRSAIDTPHFLKALRALSARYVERRASLSVRSALDSPAKRSAFAAFYAPLHFYTVREVVRALGADRPRVDRIVDLGCGTGAASAAWALELALRPRIHGIDLSGWALGEAHWNWRRLGLVGRGRRADLVAGAERLAGGRPGLTGDRAAIVLAWCVNELTEPARFRLLAALMRLSTRGTRLLVVEPLASRAVPWWDLWADRVQSVGGRADIWRFDVGLPAALAALDEAAGFRRDALGARSLWL
jgi:hypothetical protein